MKDAVIFGAGNIGRGFLGLELSQAGYDLTFVDVVRPVLEKIKTDKGYEVEIIETGETRFVPVRDALHVSSREELWRALEDASLIVTAVGPDNLRHVATLLGEPLYERAKKDAPLNVVACENMIGNSSALQGLVLSQAGHDRAEAISVRLGFPDSVVDRISVSEGTVVRVEGSYEWIVEAAAWKGDCDVTCIRYVPDLEPFVMRKLYLLNGAHATLGFMSHLKGIALVHEALRDPEIREATAGHLREANEGVSREYHLDEEEQEG